MATWSAGPWRIVSGGLRRVGRADEWWDHKIAPAMAVLYATVVLNGGSVASAWLACAELLLALSACAFYVSVINDAADREDDLAAGKSNRQAGEPAWLVASAIGGSVAVGLGVAAFWRDAPALTFAYLGSWAAFSLYSLPPFRLKVHGAFGVVADAAGAHLFPALAAALLGFRATGTDVDPAWVAAVATWAFAAGVRGILWHQLSDVESDRRANVRTFVVRRSPRVAILLARWLTFPLEIGALALMLWKLPGVAPVVCLGLYVAFILARSRMLGQRLVVVEPCERQAVVGYEFYSLLLPVGVLLLSASRHPVDLAALAAHLLLFSAPVFLIARECRLMARAPRKASPVADAPQAESRAATLKSAAQSAIVAGDLDRAEDALSEAQAIEDAAADRLASEACETGVRRARLALTRRRYAEAARHFRAAADRTPDSRRQQRLDWLENEALALFRQCASHGDVQAGEDAVDRYRRLLTVRPRAEAPLAWALVQDRLGDALRVLGERGAGVARLAEAVDAYRAALEERTRERAPPQWSATQNGLGSALRTWGEREANVERLHEAVAACRYALEERPRERAPLDWAASKLNLANALLAISVRSAGASHLEEAASAYREALGELTRERDPAQWAAIHEYLGNALRILGERGASAAILREAVAAFRAALEERTRERAPLQWATTQNNLGSAARTLGEREDDAAMLGEAVAAFRSALLERSRDRDPMLWAATGNNLGVALHALGEREPGVARLKEALATFESCLEVAGPIWPAAQVAALRARRDRVQAEIGRREPPSA